MSSSSATTAASSSSFFLMVSVDSLSHNVRYLTYDTEERAKNSKMYMWAIEILTKIMKHGAAHSFCQFLHEAHRRDWVLLPNSSSSSKEVIYLFRKDAADIIATTSTKTSRLHVDTTTTSPADNAM